MKNDKAILLGMEVDGTPTFEVISFPADGDVTAKLDWYYKHIGCDCIDIVRPYAFDDLEVKGDNGDFCLIADDEGLLRDTPIVNVLASLAYGVNKHGQVLCGKVLVCQDFETPNGIETIGLTDYEVYRVQAALDELIRQHNERVKAKTQEDKAE